MAKTLLDVLEENNIALTKMGEKMKGRCPFHEGDNDPSFVVYPNDTYYCFGCHVWGDAVKFLVDYLHFDSGQAMEYVGIDYKQKKRKPEVIKIKNTLKSYAFVWKVATQYNEYLMKNEGAKNYLLNRGLNENTIKNYNLGYTDGAVLNLDTVDDFSLGVELGVISDNGYERLSHRITIPNYLENNMCDFVTGRTVINDKVKYLNLTMPKPILGWFQVRNSPIMFMVEGQFDWLILKQWDYPAIILGGNHLSKLNASVLKDKHIIIVPDNDKIGKAAATTIAEQLPNASILDFDYDGAKDLSEFAAKGNMGLFDIAVKEHLAWKTSLSKTVLERYLPPSIIPDFSDSTLKLQA